MTATLTFQHLKCAPPDNIDLTKAQVRALLAGAFSYLRATNDRHPGKLWGQLLYCSMPKPSLPHVSTATTESQP
ncbi:hypothetical protein GCM10018966_001060 [Streptomyces yanii]